jgi:hypothetical protein
VQLLAVPGVAYARANWGRWVIDCPTPLCLDALSLPPGVGFVCPSCDARADVVWPDPQTKALIEHLLMLRPDMTTQNWEPGESTTDLLLENLAHGISSVVHPEVGASASRLVLDLVDAGAPRLRLLDEVAVIDTSDLVAIGG